MRIAILGNAGSGKSTLSRRLGQDLTLPVHEVDVFLWQDDWQPAPPETYEAAHGACLAKERWVLDGMGRMGSLPARLERATHVILCDYPIWQNFWLLAERQAAWAAGTLEAPPGGGGRDAPPTRDLFEAVWQIEQEYMPKVRAMVAACEGGTVVRRIESFEALKAFRW